MRIIQSYLHIVFSDFRFYRKWYGGVWYKIIDPLLQGGMQGSVSYWINEEPSAEKIIERKEVY